MQQKAKVLIFIVSYNAEAFIESVLSRIPEHVWHNDCYAVEVLVIDDQSSDGTFYRVADFVNSNPHRKITVLYNPVNQGYGGNQKLGYHYAIENRFDAVVLLHGDGQYAPEYLDGMIRPILRDEADVVLGSRMLKRLDALRGKMPLYKWMGNQILTMIQNQILSSHLAEFHTGYRAYRTEALKNIPFEFNSDYFDFDTDILIQMIDTGRRFEEIPIPTYYGDEISYVNGWKYAALILLTTLRSRVARLNLLYDPRFDYAGQNNQYYHLKLGYPSSHQFALDQVDEGMTVLDLGSGPGFMSRELYQRGAQVISLDRHITPMTRKYSLRCVEGDIEGIDLEDIAGDIDLVLMLDIIEHLHDPERFLLKVRAQLGQHKRPAILITTGNVAFFIVRFGLLSGQFNYGKKGILDLDHRRLFTFGSMKRLLDGTGYEILETRSIPAPYPLAIGDNWLSHLLLGVNQFLNLFSRGLFSYQMAFIARPRPVIDHLLLNATLASKRKLELMAADSKNQDEYQVIEKAQINQSMWSHD